VAGACEIKVDRGFLNFRNYISALARGELQRSQEKACEQLAEDLKKEIKKRYASHSMAHTTGTQETYAQGKAKGAWPSRRTWSGTSLNRSQGLGKHVVVTPIRGGKRGYRVQINPRVTYASAGQGDPADKSGPVDRPVRIRRVAEQMERPKPQILKVSPRMGAYLAALRAGKAGKRKTDRRIQDNTAISGLIVHMPKARKVWEPTHEGVKKHIPRFQRVLGGLLDKLAVKFGGRKL
jgi:hypothetical protein